MKSKEVIRNVANDIASDSESHDQSSDIDNVDKLFEDLESMKE